MKTIRIILFILIIIGIALICTQSLWVPALVAKILGTQNPNYAGAGQRCGGNMTTALSCAPGYHCAPVPGVHLPFGDVGGVCVAN